MFICEIWSKSSDKNSDFLVIGGAWIGKSQAESVVLCLLCERDLRRRSGI